MNQCERCDMLEAIVKDLRTNPDLELVDSKKLADELIRRTQECIVIMLRPKQVVENRGSLAFYSSLDFDRLAHMCAITHAHLWTLSNTRPGEGSFEMIDND